MPESPLPPEARAEIERTERHARVERLVRRAEELFPGERMRELREDVRRSLDVPQWGEYHNEGMFMDSHLDLIFQQIDAIAADEFPKDIPDSARDAMRRTVARDRTAVERYVFLHDISKADCLTLKLGGEEQAVTWQAWQDMLRQDADGMRALEGDEVALKHFCERRGITGISYRQDRGDTAVQHGTEGAEKLRGIGIDDAHMLAAIDTHEVAYQFPRVNAPTYERHLGALPAEAKDFALTASFVDTMASLRSDGNPDLKNFTNLAQSREKAEAMRVLLSRTLEAPPDEVGAALAALTAERGASDKPLIELVKQYAAGKLDGEKVRLAWQKMYNDKEVFLETQVEVAQIQLREKAKLARYDVEKLRAACEELAMDANTISELLELAAENPQGVNAFVSGKIEKKMIGKAMKAIKEALT